MPRASNSDLRLAAVTWLLPAIVVLGALGLILLNWEWSGLCAGVPV